MGCILVSRYHLLARIEERPDFRTTIVEKFPGLRKFYRPRKLTAETRRTQKENSKSEICAALRAPPSVVNLSFPGFGCGFRHAGLFALLSLL
jgi:hypothetical protein